LPDDVTRVYVHAGGADDSFPHVLPAVGPGMTTTVNGY